MCLLAAGMTVACTTVSQETRIATTLAASEFNGVASQYMERPTHVSLNTMSDGATTLFLELETYGRNIDPTTGVEMPYTLTFDQRYVAEYLPLIDKYEEWAKTATARGDAIEKELGTAPTWSQLGKGSLEFTFYSGNAADHYLVVDFCTPACSGQDFNFNRANVSELRHLLVSLQAGALTQTNVDAVYN